LAKAVTGIAVAAIMRATRMKFFISISLGV
jgi:hypothetical protein